MMSLIFILEFRKRFLTKGSTVGSFLLNLGHAPSRLMEKKLTESHLTVERTAEILCEIKAIPVKSPLNIVYRSESVEAERILNEMEIKQPDRILVGALPKSD